MVSNLYPRGVWLERSNKIYEYMYIIIDVKKLQLCCMNSDCNKIKMLLSQYHRTMQKAYFEEACVTLTLKPWTVLVLHASCMHVSAVYTCSDNTDTVN